MVLTRSMIAAAIASIATATMPLDTPVVGVLPTLTCSPRAVVQPAFGCAASPPPAPETEAPPRTAPEAEAPPPAALETETPTRASATSSDIAIVVRELIKAGSIKRSAFEADIGIPFKYIMEKLQDGTLDHIHMRKIKKYLVDAEHKLLSSPLPSVMGVGTASMSITQQEAAAVPALLLDSDNNIIAPPIIAPPTTEQPPMTASVSEQQHPVAKKPRLLSRAVRFAACPVLKMGYAGVECPASGSIVCNKMVEHLAAHIATLTKRVNELEMALEDLRGNNETGKLVIHV